HSEGFWGVPATMPVASTAIEPRQTDERPLVPAKETNRLVPSRGTFRAMITPQGDWRKQVACPRRLASNEPLLYVSFCESARQRSLPSLMHRQLVLRKRAIHGAFKQREGSRGRLPSHQIPSDPSLSTGLVEAGARLQPASKRPASVSVT